MNAGRKAAAIFLAASVFVMLSACGSKSLNGTYISQDMFAQTFTFDGEHVTMSAFGINAPGTYQIEDGQIKIRYTLFGMDYDWQQSFSGSGSTIYIGGTEFKKQ